MALVGMTGFGRAAGVAEGLAWSWEARSVNGRGLDLRVRVPSGFDRFDPLVRAKLQSRFSRGSIQLNLQVERREDEAGVAIDEALLIRYAEAVRPLVDAGLAVTPRAEGLLALKGVIRQSAGPALDDDDALAALDAVMLQDADAALEDLAQNRAAEGQALGEVFHAILTEIADRVRLAGETAGAQAAVLRDRLKIKLDALIAEGIAEDRLAQEAAVLAVKADVREELDRLSAHITSARALLAGEGPVGRKLDFLAQEFNREANTLCAKSADPALTEQGLALKALVDQFREQAQNVE